LFLNVSIYCSGVEAGSYKIVLILPSFQIRSVNLKDEPAPDADADADADTAAAAAYLHLAFWNLQLLP
jgi:hypothetical protein